MNIRLFTIPNLLTLGNLCCGASATVALLVAGDYTLAFWLVVAAAVFDFFDGFTARLLGCSSPIGVELDSLADMVSFGLVPAVAMFCLTGEAASLGWIPAEYWGVAQYLCFVIVAFSALRLAKFNIDDTQHTEFCGLPTPANGLLCLSLAMLMSAGEIVLSKEVIVIISIVMAYLLISPVRMFALKFKGYGLRGNEVRYAFIVLSVVLIAAFTKYAVPSIIVIYILFSAVRWGVQCLKK